ncbi:GDSL-type esterase/lipase family protein [Entomobacter blattae]|uniref:GDSL-like Lipase/Acylhydrolase family protein n=1 Tax=Entomobacter blattae TaxID=2762277 RepID=A0A7H1NRA9_9PROT|nr:GDSL-type esterase/lipase family protein [Entomobacter blattae]QNT78319.1 GDSL-like Lipase/Acylhydrolase family protein [Entomobacter blattae]
MNVILPTESSILYSPYTWHRDGAVMTAYNSGSYFKFMTNALVTGNKTLTLHFNTAEVIAALPPVVAYRIGQYNWVFSPLQSSVVMTLPPGDATTLDPVMGRQGWHFIEVWVRTVPPEINKWGAGPCRVSLTGIEIDNSARLFPISAYPLKVCIYGDSITEGYGALDLENNGYKSNNAMMSYAYNVMQALGCEAGIVGYSGQGFTKQPDNGAVPNFTQTYDYLQPGINRTLTDCDLVLINMGTNDYAASKATFVSTVTPIIQNLLDMAPKALILAMTPFNQTHAESWRTIIGNLSHPRVRLIDTSGFYLMEAMANVLHPSGSAVMGNIAPKLNAAIMTAWGQFKYGGGTGRRAVLRPVADTGAIPVLQTMKL